MKSNKIVEFGNPILRTKCKRLSNKEITSPETQKLIQNMKSLLITERNGIGLAAPQVGRNLAIAVIAIRPTAHRPNVKEFDLVVINPEISKTFNYRKQMWEGCLSSGQGGLFAKVPRYKKDELKYDDENGKTHKKIFEGLRAHVLQHEIDHINGILFMDRVKDPITYMTLKEYKKRIVKSTNRNPNSGIKYNHEP